MVYYFDLAPGLKIQTQSGLDQILMFLFLSQNLETTKNKVHKPKILVVPVALQV